MGCQAEVYIGDNLVFSICTHDPDTAVLTDADSAPRYWVYEDEITPAILTGTMTELDDANTTGFYTEQIACTAANGFEHGKSYTVYIEATVDSDKGGIPYSFRAVTDIWAYGTRTLTQSAASVAAAVSGTDLSILRGDTLSITITGLGNISDRTKLWFTIKEQTSDADTVSIVQIEETAGLLYINGSVAATSGNGSVTVDDETAGDVTITLEAVEVAKLRPSNSLNYDIQVLDSSGISTLSAAGAVIPADVTRVVE